MTAGSRRIHATQAHYKRKWFYLYIYSGKSWLKKLMKMEAPSDGLLAFAEQLEKTGDIRVPWNPIVLSFHSEKLPPYTGQILSTCEILHDASAPVQFNRARSEDKNQEEPTVLSQPHFQGLSSSQPLVGRRKTLGARLLERVLVGQKYFIATLSALSVPAKVRRYVQKSQKRWINKNVLCNRGTCMTFSPKLCCKKKSS